MSRIFAIAFLALSLAPAFGQDPAAAKAALQAHDWDKAAAEYGKITAADPQNGQAWYQLGMALYSSNKFLDAAGAFQHAADLKFTPIFSTYNAAASMARAGRATDALASLEKLAAMGYRNVQQLRQDEDFVSLRNLPRFHAVMAAVEKNKTPCEHSEQSRQFDFWIGEWDVQTPQGRHAGSSSVQKILGGCVIFENWTGALSQGKSFNAYNSSLKKWQQYWVSDSGVTTLYTGELLGNQMRYLAEAGPQNGSTEQRLTFTKLDDNRVRQLGEASNDGGKTWTVSYDLLYVRKHSQNTGRR
ncbi:MAG: tetratricopeptide repeat protein [Actinomycetota bacterium]